MKSPPSPCPTLFSLKKENHITIWASFVFEGELQENGFDSSVQGWPSIFFPRLPFTWKANPEIWVWVLMEVPSNLLSPHIWGISTWHLLSSFVFYRSARQGLQAGTSNNKSLGLIFIHLICSFIQQIFINTCYVPGPLLGSKITVVNETDRSPCSPGAYIWVAGYIPSWFILAVECLTGISDFDRSRIILDCPSSSCPFLFHVSYISKWHCYPFCCLGEKKKKQLWSYPWFLSFPQLHIQPVHCQLRLIPSPRYISNVTAFQPPQPKPKLPFTFRCLHTVLAFFEMKLLCGWGEKNGSTVGEETWHQAEIRLHVGSSHRLYFP